MFSKTTPPNNPQTPPTTPTAKAPDPVALTTEAAPRPAAVRGGQKMASLVANDMTIEGNIMGGGELQIDGVIKGDVRVERVTVGDAGQVDGGIYADAVEVRGKVSGSITAKQVRLYGACHVDGDITHEQLAMETGAFFQGRSLRLQRPAAVSQPVAAAPPRAPEPTPVLPVKDTSNGTGAAKPAAPPV
jgi:cytoskeletal protein CcmA (bactofilin family)